MRLVVEVPDAVMERFKVETKERGTTMAAVIRKAIDAYNHKKERP